MKYLKLLFIILIGVLNAQTGFIFERRDVTKNWANWDDVNKYYILQVTTSDSDVVSQEFNIPKGFDGLIQFYMQIDTITTAIPDTFWVQTGNFFGTRIDSTRIIRAGWNADDIDIIFILEYNVGAPHNWQTLDTLRWLPYTDRIGTEVETFTTQYATLYTSRFDPQATATGEDGWQGDIPLPFRITVQETTPLGIDTYQLKLNYKYHNPNY